MPAPEWLALLSPLPADAIAERKPVASAEQIASGTAGPIAGWQSISVNLSEPKYGLRHVLITLDETGQLLSGGDNVMFVRETTSDGEAMVTEHVNVGGRFESDGSFLGTHWTTILEANGDDPGESAARSYEKRAPTDEEIAALRRIINDVLNRVR